ncbi:MAG: SDR family NAD(P)-dependent oxidoreductase, partial [bacterium]
KNVIIIGLPGSIDSSKYLNLMCKRAIVTGASSGIGRALALKLASAGYRVGVLARREELLLALQSQYPGQIEISVSDVSRPESCQRGINSLIEKLGGLDLCVANAGIGCPNPEFVLAPELATVDVNIVGFVATVEAAVRQFRKQGGGHLVGISSVAALRGNARSPAYNASKAFELNYLEGLHTSLARFNIAVTDIRPGFVETEMTAQNKRMFWVAAPEVAAAQIYCAIVRKKRVAYVTARWRWPAAVMRLIPYSLWRRSQLKYLNQ